MATIAIIYEAAAAERSERLLYRRSSGDVHIFVARDPQEVLQIASGLKGEEFDLLELCGGISPSYRPKAAAAVGPGVVVSSVTFGVESLAPAAAFTQAWAAGAPPREAFLIWDEAANPAADQFRQSYPPQDTTFVPCSSADAPSVASRLVGEGVGLIELYGGFSSTDAACIIDAVAGRAAVGVGSLTADMLSSTRL